MKKEEIIKIIKNDGIGVLPTDTLYGLVGDAFSKKAIKRIYKIKEREKNKKLITLISSIDDLKRFDIKPTKEELKILKKYWPGRVSIILHSQAFRLPKKKALIEILKKTGPLVAPSANLSGQKPAETIKEAKKYFRDKIDFYVSDGRIKSKPSTLIELRDNKIKILRQGSVRVKNLT